MLRLSRVAMLALSSSPAFARAHHRHHHHHAAALASGRPAVCAGIPWCGCWLRLHLGIDNVRLNLARAWTSIGAAGVIAVWPHHVGRITENLGSGMIHFLSGNVATRCANDGMPETGARENATSRRVIGVFSYN